MNRLEYALCFSGMHRIILIIGFLALATGTSLFAQEVNKPAPEDLRQTFIETSALPAIETIISSLESQNAPVPPELVELTELTDDADAFYALAEKYFGYNWQERLSNEAQSLKDSGNALMMRTRLFLSSLKNNAGRISKNSPLDESEISAFADNLIRFSQHAKSDEDSESFLEEFEKAYMEIFPAEGGPDISSFRNHVSILLNDTSDAISILAGEGKLEKLSAELDELKIRLELVDGTQELAAWLAVFDSFMGKMLSHAVQADRVTVIKDIRALLSNFVSYLSRLSGEGADETGLLEDAEEMLYLAEKNVFDDEEFEELISGTEEILNIISGKDASR